MKKAIIFDMDGTLWDTTPLLHEVWNRVMQNYEETKGRYLSLEEIRGLMGKTMYEIGPAIDKESTWIEVMSTMKRDIHQSVTIFPLIPRYRAEVIDDTTGNVEYDDELEFSQAIDYIMDIADNPKRTINLV